MHFKDVVGHRYMWDQVVRTSLPALFPLEGPFSRRAPPEHQQRAPDYPHG